ncbi:MAG: glycosyltransferase, partial [Janthinobacterium lividum]
GWPGDWVVLDRDDAPPLDEVSATAGGRLHWVPVGHRGLRSRMSAVAAWIERAQPTLMVVDVSVEVTLLARLCGVPVVVCAMLGDRDDPAHRLGRDVARALIAPWPGAPHRPGADGVPVEHVGAFSRFDGRVRAERARSGSVLVLWGSGGSDLDEAQLAAARAATPGWRWVYRIPGPSTSTGDEDASAGDDDVWDALEDAEVVVVHGGHNAVAEVAAARRPAVVVAQQRPFDEQLRRVELLRKEGIVALDGWPAATGWPDLLERARRVGGGPWARWSPGDGARRAARLLDGFAGERR